MKNTIAGLALSLALPLAAEAQLVAYTITAEVIDVDDPFEILGDAVQLEDILTGVMQYDLSLADESDDPSIGSFSADAPSDNYINGTNGASGNFETLDFFGAYVEDNAPWGADYLLFYGSGDTTPSALEHPAVEYIDLDVELIDYDQDALSSDALPGSIDLADFEEANLFLTGEWFNPETLNYEFSFSVEAIITALTPVGPPSPPGDFNNDGSVDAADYTVWRDGLGDAYEASDYDEWVANYGATASAAQPAPAPAAVSLLLIALAQGGRTAARSHRPQRPVVGTHGL
ncbi:hypothetical protein KOR34_16740 [Posidoniimonas corsicana]|uniref:PEP-CTERM protein-sorting domain-containing protein n=1 Tax=Posidoniimonas corsicana TaxID=1938618 RepID=A0A5C5VDP2_9BACT|nr:hypothetical protein [Posidoniimonas corsicana]TWT36734.1 hypothetical protein KOR34_16740 [Posidoniimonas corsicana]